MTNDTTFTRRATLRAAGIAGAGVLALGATAGSAAATGPCEECAPLGKIEGQPEVGDEYEFTAGEYTVRILIEEVGYEDNEVVRAKWKVLTSDIALCRVDVKGGPAIKSRTEFDGSPYAVNANANAPAMHDRNPNRTQYAISFIQFWVCVPEGTEFEPAKEHPVADGPPGQQKQNNNGR